MREVVSRCDICGGDENVTTFLVTFDGQSWEVDLDEKSDARHSKPLHVLIEKYGRKRIVQATNGATRPGIRALESRVRGVGAAQDGRAR